MLLIFEEELENLRKILEENVIRLANSRQNPQNPLRPGLEITYDATGQFVLPNSKTGISLAASLRQVDRLLKPGIKKWLLAVPRNSVMPEGLALQPDNPHHWSVVVTKKMTRAEYNERRKIVISTWTNIGMHVRYE